MEQIVDEQVAAQPKSGVTDLLRKAEDALPEGVSFDNFYSVDYTNTLNNLRLQGKYDSKVVIKLMPVVTLAINSSGYAEGVMVIDGITINIIFS